MIIKGILSEESKPKITSYYSQDRDFTFLVDAGNGHLPIADVKRIQAIFLTHAHADHTIAFFRDEFINHLDGDVKIFATKTTKELLKVLIKNQHEIEMVRERYTPSFQKKIDHILTSIIEVTYDNKINLSNERTITFYKAGHMLGAAMVYYEHADQRVLFTGDIDFAWISQKDNQIDLYRSYDQRIGEKINPTMVIADGTTISQSFLEDGFGFKHDKITKIIKDIQSSYHKRPFYLLTRYDKAIPIARRLAQDDRLKNYKIVYGSEFLPTNRVVYEAGYDIYQPGKLYQDFGVLNDVMRGQFENHNYVYITSKKSNVKASRDYTVSLHIAFDDLLAFLLMFPKARIVISHYNLEERLAYESFCQVRNFELFNPNEAIEIL
jgi:hypothetical protein